MSNNTLTDRKLLEKFVLDNPELEQLEALLSQFNIFEAIGAVHRERHHSDFLAFLLNPAQNHGLNDLFLKRLLMRVLSKSENAPVSLIKIEVGNLTDAVVTREWHNIDILIVVESINLVVVVENKLGTGEHSNQLTRYRNDVKQLYPSPTYDHVFIFLTPDETLPLIEDDQTEYISLGYATVCEILDSLRKTRSSTMGTELKTLIEHYTTMLRRHIVSDSDIADLCRVIYQKHKQALDIIYKHILNLQQEIINYCIEKIKSNSELVHESNIKRAAVFGLTKWDKIGLMHNAEKSGGSNRLLRFWITCENRGLYLYLYLLPSKLKFLSQSIFESVQKKSPPFRPYKRIKIIDKWQYIYWCNTLINKEIETASTLADVKSQIDEFWQQFLQDDLPALSQVIENEIDWIALETQASKSTS